MTTSKFTNAYNRQNWEGDADFPVLCETCLGPCPYLRITKEKFGQACKICERPFTVFRWQPGARMRFKKTQVCQVCAKLKNVCQTCLLDLEYGLPTQVRDAALGNKEALPTSDVNKEYAIQNKEAELAAAGGLDAIGFIAADGGHNDMLQKLKRTTPYYKRNLPHICSFWVKGECSRGDLCPYRHEMPTDPKNPLAKQNMKDRYYGTNDPVAEKMMRRYKSRGGGGQQALQAPVDKTVTTLFIGGVDGKLVTEKDLRDHFYQFGELKKVHVVARQQAAFIEYTLRQSAEQAATGSSNLRLNGVSLRVMWGRSRKPLAVTGGPPGAAGRAGAAIGAGGAAMMPPPPPGAPGGMRYPSMDTAQQGARLPKPATAAST